MYYHLKDGEIIRAGDEVEASNSIHDEPKWEPTRESLIGTAAPDPKYTAHRQYRREKTMVHVQSDPDGKVLHLVWMIIRFFLKGKEYEYRVGRRTVSKAQTNEVMEKMETGIKDGRFARLAQEMYQVKEDWDSVRFV